MSKPKGFFITSSGTGVGKTLVTSALAYQLHCAGKEVTVQKPIITGWDENQVSESDTAILLQSSGQPVTPQAIDKVSPWRFSAPLSPHLAAEIENMAINIHKVIEYSQHTAEGEYLLVEGVGGAMVPLTYEYHSLQWMQALNYPAIVVVGCYLGAISHALTTLTALASYGVQVAGIIVSDTCREPKLWQPTIDTLRQFTHVPVMGLPYISKTSKMPLWQGTAEKLPNLISLVKKT